MSGHTVIWKCIVLRSSGGSCTVTKRFAQLMQAAGELASKWRFVVYLNSVGGGGDSQLGQFILTFKSGDQGWEYCFIESINNKRELIFENRIKFYNFYI